MNKAHTPAPWRLNGCELIADNTVIATVHWHSGRDAENAADGALMQAAPQLFEALALADAALRGANMNRSVVARKVAQALALAGGEAWSAPTWTEESDTLIHRMRAPLPEGMCGQSMGCNAASICLCSHIEDQRELLTEAANEIAALRATLVRTGGAA